MLKGLTFPKMVFGSWGFVVGGIIGIMMMPEGVPLRWALLPIVLAFTGAYAGGGVGERYLRKAFARLDRA